MVRKGRVKRVLAYADTRNFWLIVGAFGILFVFSYTFVADRSIVIRNQELIASQQQALSYLCETVHTLDAVNVQTIAIDHRFLLDPSISPSVKRLIHERIEILETAHEEFSDTRACRQVE